MVYVCFYVRSIIIIHSFRLVSVVSFFVYRWHGCCYCHCHCCCCLLMICFGENFRNGCHFIVQLQVYVIILGTCSYRQFHTSLTTSSNVEKWHAAHLSWVQVWVDRFQCGKYMPKTYLSLEG